MCHATMIRAKQAGMSVKDYLAMKRNEQAKVIRVDANHELRAVDEEVNGKTRRRWIAYQLSPFYRITEVYPCTRPDVVAADLTDLLRGA